jgi:hypothetical protein
MLYAIRYLLCAICYTLYAPLLLPIREMTLASNQPECRVEATRHFHATLLTIPRDI